MDPNTYGPHVNAGLPASNTGKSSSGACMPVAIVGCLGFVLVAIIGLGVVGALLFLRTSGVDLPIDEEDAEVIVYGKVKDRKTGPSSTRPSGKSGKDLTKPQGVIRSKSKEIHRATKISYPENPKYCQNNDLLTDLPKSLLFDLDRQMRDSTRLPIEEEIALGEELAKMIRDTAPFKDKLDTPSTAAWRKYLARVAQPLLAEIERKDMKYHFHVVDEPIVNAFAMPGGHIYFYTGLLENKGGTWLENEAQLATILAHEISHVDLGHTTVLFQYLKKAGMLGSGAEGLAQAALYYARHPFSSNQEAEADEVGCKIIYWAQYSPKEAVNMWKLWHKQRDKRNDGSGGGKGDVLTRELENLLRSHPASNRRACNLMKHANAIMGKDRFDRFYVGESNLRKRRARTKKQY